jgi:hypothetical protein
MVTYYLWFMLVGYSMSMLGLLSWMATGNIPQRTPKTLALNVAFSVFIIIWTVILIIKNS